METDLLDLLIERLGGESHLLARQTQDLKSRLGAVGLVEAQALYRLIIERSELPQLTEPLAYLEHPFVLFGADFVAAAVEDLRSGRRSPPTSVHIHYEPLDEEYLGSEF